MNPVAILIGYIFWHYGRAFGDIFRVWGNVLWFTFHFFSLGLLIRTLFSPWKRLHEEYESVFQHPIKAIFSFWVNIVMRIFGFVIRIVIIAIALVTFLTITVSGVIFIVLWIFAPIALIIIFIKGLSLLFL